MWIAVHILLSHRGRPGFHFAGWIPGATRHGGGLLERQPGCIHGFASGFVPAAPLCHIRAPRVIHRIEMCGSRGAQGLSRSLHPAADFGRCPCLSRVPVLEGNRELPRRQRDRTFHCCVSHFLSLSFHDSSLLAGAPLLCIVGESAQLGQ